MWAPFYTYHKIMAGLLDMYLLVGNADASADRRRHGPMGAGVHVGLQHRSAPAHAAHRVRRHERSPRQSCGRHQETNATSTPPISSSSPAFSIRLPHAATSCRACMRTRTFPRSSARPACMRSPAIAAIAQIAEYFLEEVLTARNYVIGNTSLDEHLEDVRRANSKVHWPGPTPSAAWPTT